MTKILLTPIALLALRGTDLAFKEKLAADLGVSTKTIWRWINANDDNLTTAKALKVIRKKLELKDDDLLTEVDVSAVATAK